MRTRSVILIGAVAAAILVPPSATADPHGRWQARSRPAHPTNPPPSTSTFRVPTTTAGDRQGEIDPAVQDSTICRALTATTQPGANPHLRRLHTVGFRFREGDDDDSATTARRGRDRDGRRPDRHGGGLLTVEPGRTGQPRRAGRPVRHMHDRKRCASTASGCAAARWSWRAGRSTRRPATAGWSGRTGRRPPAGTAGDRSIRVGQGSSGVRVAGTRTATTALTAPRTKSPEMGRPPSRFSWLDKPGARGPGSCREFASARRAQVIPGTWCC